MVHASLKVEMPHQGEVEKRVTKVLLDLEVEGWEERGLLRIKRLLAKLQFFPKRLMSHSLDDQILMDHLISSRQILQHLLDMLELKPSELFIPRHHHGSLYITKLFILLGHLQQLL